CVTTPKSDGTTCDDGLFCTQNDMCAAGVCTGTPLDCSGLGDQCNAGACDEVAQGCVKQAKTDGTGCDDGQLCTDGDHCAGGTCVGTPRHCSPFVCHDAPACDPTTGACVSHVVPDGTPCPGGDACTRNPECEGGRCVGTTTVACDDGNICTE